MLKKFVSFVLFAFLVSAGTSCQALEIVYPKKAVSTITAKSSFLIGNVGQDKFLTINDIPVPIHKNGVFVHVVPLNNGENVFELKSTSEDGTESVLIYKINKPFPLKASAKPVLAETETFPNLIYAEISGNNAPLRSAPNDSAQRLAHYDKGTKLFLDGKQGSYYRVYVNDKTKYWIKGNFVQTCGQAETPIISDISKFKFKQDRKYKYYYFKTDMPVPYTITEKEKFLNIKLFYVSNTPKKLYKHSQKIYFKDNVLSFDLSSKGLMGYDVSYENGSMILRTTKPLHINKKYPLKNIKIAIDAGHGGTEAGAIGPTRIREAEIALDISKRVEKLLIEEKAKPFMTREENVNVGLYERVEKIKEFDPVFSISIHANALPDGLDPYKKYGTAVYYYNTQAKKFADTVKNSITSNLGTRDDGTSYASFVLTRMTSPIAILVETAYMINPFDYEKLLDENCRQIIAQSIVDGIKKYLLSQNN